MHKILVQLPLSSPDISYSQTPTWGGRGGGGFGSWPGRERTLYRPPGVAACEPTDSGVRPLIDEYRVLEASKNQAHGAPAADWARLDGGTARHGAEPGGGGGGGGRVETLETLGVRGARMWEVGACGVCVKSVCCERVDESTRVVRLLRLLVGKGREVVEVV